MTETCKVSGRKFQITEKDLEFYKEMGVPTPQLCPEERQRLRLSFRNELNLYKRKCDLTGKDIISIYSPDKPYKVYDHNVWWSDQWDPLEYGRDFDFNRPFFEQFKELLDVVPRIGVLVLGDNENSDYTHDNYRLKNCYLVFDGEQGYDSLYGETFVITKSCVDFYQLTNCEFCYECVRCQDCHNVNFSSFCNNCSDSYFLQDCQGCRNCFGCCNLRQKEYHILNEPYSKEEYFEKIKTFEIGSHSALEKLKESSKEFFLKFPKKFVRGLMNENVIGDFLYNCKDCEECYDCSQLRDCKYCTDCQMAANDCHDIDIWGDGMQFCYNCEVTGAGAERIVASYYGALNASNVYHSYFCCNNVHNLLGCTGLTQKKYCILNKQYTKEEYKKLFQKIKKHMEKTGEWGEFFPAHLSSFAYNETVAQDFFPLKQEEAEKLGYKWKEKDPADYKKQSYATPDTINEVEDSIVDEILACSLCSRNYRITVPELKFYRRQSLPIPRNCFYCRHKARKSLKNPRQLFDRTCEKCQAPIRTTYQESQPEIVYCESCYLKEVR